VRKRFVVLAGPLDEVASNKITKLFRGEFGWWHWIDGAWLLTDAKGHNTVTTIRERIKAEVPGIRILVLDADSSAWAGSGPRTENRSMFRWIRETWNKQI
jgi:hypothetical protein